jgi:hypothetical protein
MSNTFVVRAAVEAARANTTAATNGEDVYVGCKIDYKGNDVNP